MNLNVRLKCPNTPIIGHGNRGPKKRGMSKDTTIVKRHTRSSLSKQMKKSDQLHIFHQQRLINLPNYFSKEKGLQVQSRRAFLPCPPQKRGSYTKVKTHGKNKNRRAIVACLVRPVRFVFPTLSLPSNIDSIHMQTNQTKYK